MKTASDTAVPVEDSGVPRQQDAVSERSTAEGTSQTAGALQMPRNKWTPGPWRAEERGVNFGVVFVGEPKAGVRRNAVCYSADGAAPERVANCRLIAAAPDLYEALRQMVEEKADYMRINLLGDPETQHTIALARAALSKASA